MKFFRYLMLTVVAVFMATPLMAQPEVVTWKTKVTHVKDDVYRVTFEVDIQAGWHIYDLGPYEGGPTATSFTFEKSPNVELVGKIKPVKPQPRHMDDVWGMEIGYVEGKGSFTQDVKLKGDKATLKGVVEWQSCDETSCLPPMEYEFSIEIVKAAKPVAEANAANAGTTETAAATAAAAVPEQSADEVQVEEPAEQVAEAAAEAPAVTAVDEQDTHEEKRSFWGEILKAIGWGFLALLTPCVFPMVPVTVSFFMKGSENKASARFRAVSFGLFIIILYTLPIAIVVFMAEVFGGAAGATGVFNWLATHWLPNSIFFIIFMVFAASFFGAFEITLPSSMINKSDSKADKGGLLGVFFMALTLVLISFSCTAPIVSNVIVDAATSSTTWWQPIIVMLVYSTIFAIPFTLLAFAPSLMSKLKSGSWLNAVKVSLGFVEVALGFKFLMIIDQSYGLNMLSRELYIALWVVCGFLWGLYLIGVYKTKHDSDVTFIGPMRLTFAIIVFIFTVWMIPGMWGAPLKPLSGYMPPLTAQSFSVATVEDLKNISISGGGSSAGSNFAIQLVDGKNPVTGQPIKYGDVDKIHTPNGFVSFYDVAEAQAYAKHVNKPVFIDITGATCVNCREMEQNVWTDPVVAKMLREDYVMVCVFLDVKHTLPESDWVVNAKGETLKRLDKINMDWALTNYQTVGQPTYVIMDPRDGKLLGPLRAYDKSVKAYTEWLQQGLTNYSSK